MEYNDYLLLIFVEEYDWKLAIAWSPAGYVEGRHIGKKSVAYLLMSQTRQTSRRQVKLMTLLVWRKEDVARLLRGLCSIKKKRIKLISQRLKYNFIDEARRWAQHMNKNRDELNSRRAGALEMWASTALNAAPISQTSYS